VPVHVGGVAEDQHQHVHGLPVAGVEVDSGAAAPHGHQKGAQPGEAGVGMAMPGAIQELTVRSRSHTAFRILS